MDADRTLLTAERVMQRNVVTLSPEGSVIDAVQTLLQKGISGAPVVQDGIVVGMFSERDSLTVLASAAYEAEPSGTVAQHMRRQFKCVASDTDLFQIADMFRESPIRRMPVVDCAGRMLGLVMRGDVLRVLHQHYFAREQPPPRSNYDRIQEQLEGPFWA